jgi:hypothetical protein
MNWRTTFLPLPAGEGWGEEVFKFDQGMIVYMTNDQFSMTNSQSALIVLIADARPIRQHPKM